MVNRVGPDAETGKGAEIGMVSGAEAAGVSVVETEMGSEDDTVTETVEGTGLARGEELGTGIGEEAGPGSEDGTGREEEMVKGAAPGAEAVETEDELAPEFFLAPSVSLSHPFPYPQALPDPQKTFIPKPWGQRFKESDNLTFPFPPKFRQMYLGIR